MKLARLSVSDKIAEIGEIKKRLDDTGNLIDPMSIEESRERLRAVASKLSDLAWTVNKLEQRVKRLESSASIDPASITSEATP